MKKLLYIFLITLSTISYSQTAITDANFRNAINTCLLTNPVDGLCSDSEYGSMPDWDVSNVTDMSNAFAGEWGSPPGTNTYDFNADISSWDVSNVTNFYNFFFNAYSFNQDISGWNVSSASNMFGMFYGMESFTQDISSWDVSNVTNMYLTFGYNTAFNQNIGSWDVSNVVNMSGIFQETGLSTENYDNILIGWSQLPSLISGVPFGALQTNYCDGEAARQYIIDTYNWNITDAGYNCSDVCYIIAPADITVSSCDDTTTFGEATFSGECYTTSVFNDASSLLNIGDNIITWTVTSDSGNVSTDTQIVTVIDDVNPAITAPASVNVSTNDGCNAINISLGSATTTDNCSVTSVTNDAPTSFDIGETTVTWTVTDESGNSSTDTQIVTVIDDVNPAITAPASVNVSTNDGCNAINISLGSATTTDNCSVTSVTNDAPTSFDIGETTVTWTVTDESGNSSTDTQTIVVTDNFNPTVICNELSLTLENGVASISAVDIDNGSYDECGEITLEINQTDFDESHIGDNIVVLTVTDEYGNSSSCETTVTVEAGMGIEDNILANIYLYPNPTSDLVFIGGVDSELNAVVYDLLGKQVMRKHITKKININILEKGVYFVKLSNGISNSVHKIIKN
ncbi:BspA family leucine-rich repeat surface protein [Flavobacteriaceae bacterium]|nr:BspA family leucine-rich repeat surface protein [Flavobacteriaceae bacterium]